MINNESNVVIDMHDHTHDSTYPPRDTYLSLSVDRYYPAFLPIKQEEQARVRGLFETFIVDAETEVVLSFMIVAKDEASAQLKGALLALAEVDIEKTDDYDIIVRRIGDVRAKREKKD